MKWLFKWALRLALLLAAVLAILFLSKDAILRKVTEHRIRKQTGMDVQIGKLSAGLFSPVVTITGLKLYNTREFGGTLFLDIPELHIECDPVALAQQKLRINLLRMNLAELAVVRNEAGKTNLFSLLDNAQTKTPGRDGEDLLGDFDFTGIEVLNLTLGKAKFVDLKDPRNSREIALDLQNQIFREVRTEADAYGILFIIWLRSGGTFFIRPSDLAQDYVDRRLEQVEATVKTNLIKSSP